MCDGVEDCPLGDDELPSLCSKLFAKTRKKLTMLVIHASYRCILRVIFIFSPAYVHRLVKQLFLYF